VLALSSMTRLAGDIRVAAEFLLLNDLSVTALADCVAGECGRAGTDLDDGVTAVVSILAKAPGHDGGAEHNKDEKRQHHHDSEADEMFGVFKHGCLSRPESGKRRLPLRPVIWDTGGTLGRTMSEITGGRDSDHSLEYDWRPANAISLVCWHLAVVS